MAGNGPEMGRKLAKNAKMLIQGMIPPKIAILHLKIGFLTQKSIPLLPGVR